MKKALLSVAAVTASVITGWANEYTFVFDGNNDMGGLTRQTSTNPDELTFSDEFSLNEEGVQLSVKNTAATGKGFALVNAGGTNAGILVYASMASNTSMSPEITLSVPNGKITGAKLYMSGMSLITLDIDFNGKLVEPQNEGALYSWTWTDAEGVESLSMGWVNNFSSRYIHRIELSYSPDLGGKQECGLSFAAKDYEAFLGEDFKAPTLKNPNRLDVSWSSSDESVATVDASGKVTLVGRGQTTIAASTEGNDEFAAGNAKYQLVVIPTASNIAQLLEYAPSVYDRVKVNFPATVNFGNASLAFVTDAEGNAACFDDMRNRNSTSTNVPTIYSVGQVIPAGWIATNATIYQSVVWEGLPARSTETVEVTYAKVNAVTPADADRVVILKNVTFETRTAEGFTKAFGTTPDGTRYEFQDTYDVSAMPAGTYDVTCVVRYSKVGSTEYFYLAPIAYSDPSGEEEAPEFPSSFDVSVSFEGAEVTQGEEYEVYTVNVTGTAPEATYTVTVAVPEGWDGFIGMTDSDFSSDIDPLASKVQAFEWMPLDAMLENGFRITDTLAFPADGEEHMGFLYLYKGDQVEVANVIQIATEVSSEGSGVEAVAADSAAEYYNLNGVRVADPKGITVKVVNGKATKVRK